MPVLVVGGLPPRRELEDEDDPELSNRGEPVASLLDPELELPLSELLPPPENLLPVAEPGVEPLVAEPLFLSVNLPEVLLEEDLCESELVVSNLGDCESEPEEVRGATSNLLPVAKGDPDRPLFPLFLDESLPNLGLEDREP